MVITVADLITSFLLIAQFRLRGTVSFAILGGAFLFTGLMATAQLLASPRILLPDGLFGGGDATAASLWLYWHGGFAGFVLAFSAAELGAKRAYPHDPHTGWSLELTVLAPIMLVMSAILVAGLPATPTSASFHSDIPSIGGLIRVLNLIAFGAVLYATRGRTVGDLALAVATLASLFDVLLSVGATPYSVGWYVGRLFSLLSSFSILLVFLAEATQLYGRTIALNIALEKIAHLDGLTGLPNRRQFDERLETEWRGAARRRSSVGLLMIDVDFFKRYNDRYGHMEGDEALRRVAGAIRDMAKRTTDLAARYGGEEFAVILPDTELAAAAILAEAIRGEVKRRGIPHDGNPPAGVVTVSVGVAAIVPDARVSPDLLTRAADEALYAAKHQGRDRIALGQIDELLQFYPPYEPERASIENPAPYKPGEK